MSSLNMFMSNVLSLGVLAVFKKLSLEQNMSQEDDDYVNTEIDISSKPNDLRQRIVDNLASYKQERRDKLLTIIRKELEEKPMNDRARKRMQRAFSADIHTLVAYLREELFDNRINKEGSSNM